MGEEKTGHHIPPIILSNPDPDNKIALLVDCPKCEGEGIVENPIDFNPCTCFFCRGTGKVSTGYAIFLLHVISHPTNQRHI